MEEEPPAKEAESTAGRTCDGSSPGAVLAEEADPYRMDGGIGHMDYRDRITIEPGKRSGKPCIRGMRITVSDVLDYLASGMSAEQILAELPDLEREDINAALTFAAERERRMMSLPPA